MKKIILVLIFLFASSAVADTKLRKYGVQTTVDFCLHITDATVGAVTVNNAVCADTGSADDSDVQIMKDEGAPTDTTNCFTDEGNCYSIVLTATEMQAERIHMLIEDRTGTKVWADKAIDIETYGNASAMHAFDLDTATQSVSVATGGVGALSVAFDGVTLAEGSSTIDLEVNELSANNQFQGDKISFYSTTGKYYGSRCIISSTDANERVTLDADIQTLHTVGDSYKIRPDAGCSLKLATTEPAACLTATANALDQINFVATSKRNKVVQNATDQILYKDDGATALCTKAVTTGATFTLGEGS